MMTIPLTSDGARSVTVAAGDRVLTFRSYFSAGQESCWLLDLFDSDGELLLSGLKLVPGAADILKGQGDLLEGYQLYVFLDEGSAGALDAPGNNLQLILYEPGEENLFTVPDPLMVIGRRQYL